MCLSIAIERPEDVLARGDYLGFEWLVIHNRLGFRCGYIRVPVGHPWHGKHYDDVGAVCHGGLTFSEPDVNCDKGGADDAHWFGFDCAHGGDSPDPELPTDDRDFSHQWARSILGDSPSNRGVTRTQEYVEAECRSLCEQAAQVAVSGSN